jgi:hypothetical protein
LAAELDSVPAGLAHTQYRLEEDVEVLRGDALRYPRLVALSNPIKVEAPHMNAVSLDGELLNKLIQGVGGDGGHGGLGLCSGGGDVGYELSRVGVLGRSEAGREVQRGV